MKQTNKRVLLLGFTIVGGLLSSPISMLFAPEHGAKLFYWKAFIYGCLAGCLIGASILFLFGLAYSGYIGYNDKKAAAR